MEDQKEVNINVDFHTGGDEPKAVFTEVKETDEAEGRKSVQSVKEKTSRVTYLRREQNSFPAFFRQNA